VMPSTVSSIVLAINKSHFMVLHLFSSDYSCLREAGHTG
jgi:hypothetical protein